MRISLSHHVIRKGFMFKTNYYEVHLQASFSHEEMQVIRMRKLEKTKLMDRRPATAKVDDRDEKFELRLSDLFDGKVDRFLCATPSKAKIYEEQLLAAMQQVKLWLNDNTDVGTRKVIEF